MPKPRSAPGAPPKRTVIGWRELIELPDLGLPPFPAKIDIGARTSALHAYRIRLGEADDGTPVVSFTLPTIAGQRGRRLTRPLADERRIKNTGGQPEMRYVIRTALRIAGRRWLIDVSLTDRSNMTHELILGRTAVRGRHLLVDPGRSFLAGQPSDPSVPAGPRRRAAKPQEDTPWTS